MIVYSTRELRAKIASHDYSAELCLQHAMANIGALEMEMEALRKDAERYRALKLLACKDGGKLVIEICDMDTTAVGDFSDAIDEAADAAMAKEPR